MGDHIVLNPGKYWIGDPCYAIRDSDWEDFLDLTDYCDKPANYNGALVVCGSTAFGDGEYSDNKGNLYGVDAGALCIMPIEVATGDSVEFGVVHIFPEPFVVRIEDGFFRFGSVTIDTN